MPAGISYLYPDRPSIDKAPGAAADLDYGFDWAAWLAPLGDTIASATVTASGGLTVSNVAYNATQVSCKVTGGTVGVEAVLTCVMVTAGAPVRTDTRSIWVRVVQR